MNANGELEVLAVKVVDDVLITGNISELRTIVKEISNKYEVGTIVYSPATFLFKG